MMCLGQRRMSCDLDSRVVRYVSDIIKEKGYHPESGGDYVKGVQRSVARRGWRWDRGRSCNSTLIKSFLKSKRIEIPVSSQHKKKMILVAEKINIFHFTSFNNHTHKSYLDIPQR